MEGRDDVGAVVAFVGGEVTVVVKVFDADIPKLVSSKLSAKVKPAELGGNNHKLAVVVQGGSGGPLASLKRKFKTC